MLQNLNILKYILSILVIILHLRPFLHYSNELDLAFNNIVSIIDLLYQQESRVVQLSITFLILSITLLLIIFNQFYLISKNITSSEVYLYKEEQIKNAQPIKNIYDRGLLFNWFQIIFFHLWYYF